VIALETTGCGSMAAGDFAPIDGRAPRASAPARDGSVEVHLSDPNAVLEHRLGGDGQWSVACRAPCDTLLPRADEYRVTREGVPRRLPFLITAPPGTRVTVDVAEPSSDDKKVDGVIVGVLAGIGVAALLAGYVVVKAVSGSSDE
jgi:hypothetical protein